MDNRLHENVSAARINAVIGTLRARSSQNNAERSIDMAAVPLRTRILPWLRVHRVRLLLLFIGVLVPLWVFGALAEDVLEQERFFFDDPILLFLRSYTTAWLDNVMLFFSLIGYRFGVVPADLIVLAIFVQRRRWADALFWVLAVGGAALLNLLAKRSFGRPRPDLWLSIAPETTYSFPSGHAMGSMALAMAVIVLAWPTRWRWPALIGGVFFVVMVGVSRLYLGVHYPSDIMAGWMASLAWVIGVSFVLYGRLTKPTPQAEPSRS